MGKNKKDKTPPAPPPPTLDDIDWSVEAEKTCCIHLEAGGYVGTIPTEIGLLTGLTSDLYLNDNSLTGTIPTEIGRLTLLSASIHFDANSLIGTIPTELGLIGSSAPEVSTGTAPHVVVVIPAGFNSGLYLQDNSLTGSIPSEIGRLTAITKSLYIHDNMLSGSIPSEIFHLSNLVDGLELHSNNLCDVIPSEIGRMNQLTGYFSLYDNPQICGPMPGSYEDLIENPLPGEGQVAKNWNIFQGNGLNATCTDTPCTKLVLGDDDDGSSKNKKSDPLTSPGAIAGFAVGGILVLLLCAFGCKTAASKLGSSGGGRASLADDNTKSPIHDGGFYQPPAEGDTMGGSEGDSA